ncbi:outer membrane protein HomA [Helicobacter cetorum]|uniref:Outer membrane protein HomA n=1 Tax=Helicobacter cetorum (strain ATCC BAA-540 / CCUG 52418 / MIT 99-5656) TaxID=1163745 RepID=I0ET48_HELCM|nr:outer membrane protein HomA [Helicobacter cetorum]AFI06117.1 Outer membrane protein HomA [Helicobacter cetorum MIT 99-5656]
MKKISKNACLVVASFLSECEAHPKSGFFVEGGFETGMLESKEIKRELQKGAVATPLIFLNQLLQTPKKAYFSNAELKKDTQALWTAQNVHDNANGFSTTNMIKVSFDKATNSLNIKNFLPYDLYNVVIVMDNKTIAGLATIDAFSRISLNASLIDALENNPNATLKIEPSSFSDENTKRVFESLSKISVDINGFFGKMHNTSMGGLVNVEQAKDFTNIFLDYAYVLSSKAWADAVKNFPKPFTNKGQTISPETLITQYRKSVDLYLSVFSNRGAEAGAVGNCPIQGLKENCALFALMDKVFDPKINPFLKGLDENINKARSDFGTLVHEFGHVKGYDHEGNLTCPNGSVMDFCKSDKPKWHHGKKYYPGMIGVTQNTWQELGRADKLPINYKTIGQSFNPGASVNESFANSFVNTIKQVISHAPNSNTNNPASATNSSSPINVSSLTNAHIGNRSTTTSKNYHSSMVGFNFKLGYQQYFNNHFGLAYYGIVKYNYTKLSNIAQQVNQVGLGVGAEILLDFTKNFGVFSGARALYNQYHLLKQIKNAGNIEFVGGFNFWHNKSKYSIGVSLPLIQRNIKTAFETINTYGHVLLKEGISHFNVFFNYGWVF